MGNLATLLDRTAERHPERTAIVSESRHLTYAELDAGASQVASLLIRSTSTLPSL